MEKVYSVEEARRKAETFCAYQDRCHAEVIEKLRSWRMIPEAVDVILVHLIQNNYLNEERFARSFARGKHRIKGWGIPRIEMELKQRGLSLPNIKAGLSEIASDAYDEKFDDLARRKWESLSKEEGLKRRKKCADYLLRKGFEPQKVYDKIHRLSQT